MARRKKAGADPVPPGARTRATRRDERPGGPKHTPMDESPHAAGTPAGGTEVGGLGGTNIGDGSPDNADLDAALGSGEALEPEAEGEEGPFAGPSGGAVGGTPAGDRSSGGRTHRGIAPGGVHRGDSTIGSKPDKA
jgi:hypothetical protein